MAICIDKLIDFQGNTSMTFEFDLEDLHFFIELLESPSYRPDLKHSEWIEEDLELWREGKLSYFQLLITSSDESGEEKMHYVPGILLPLDDEDEMQERIEVFLEGETGLDKILAHWEESEEDKPSWAL